MKTPIKGWEVDDFSKYDPDEVVCELRDSIWYEFNHGINSNAKIWTFCGAFYCSSIGPKEHVQHFHGLAQFLENDYEGAEKFLGESLERIRTMSSLKLRHVQAWEDYIIVLLSLHRHMEAYQLLDRIEKMYQDVGETPKVRFYVRAAIICRDLERYDEVKGYLDKAEAIDSGSSVFLTNKLVQLWEGYLLSSEKDPYKADCLKDMDSVLQSMKQKLPAEQKDAVLKNNYGVLHYLKQEYKKSSAYVSEALEIDPYDAVAYFNKGLAEFRLSQYDNAMSAFDQARVCYLKKHQPGGARNAELFFNISQIKLSGKPDEDEDESEFLNFLFNFLDTIDNHENFFIQRFHAESQFYENLLGGRGSRDLDGKLVILRGWCSSVPPAATISSPLGGGYYLRWRGFGIVIDPGYHFVRNFLQRGFSINDIHAVIMTSSMPDHCSDFEVLLSLLRTVQDLRHTAAEEPHSIDPYIKEKLPQTDKKVDLLLTADVEAKFEYQIKTMYGDVIGSVGHLSPEKDALEWVGQNGNGKKPVFRLTPVTCKVQRSGDWDRPAGFVLELLKTDGSVFTRMGYTSDTMWVNDLESGYPNCNLLIAHIGPIRATEFKSEGQRDDKLSPEHLGLFGCFRLIEQTRPKVFLIADMGPELARRRSKVVDEFNKRFWSREKKEHSTKTISSDLGMVIDLSSLSVKPESTNSFIQFSDVEERFKVLTDEYLYSW